jgi:hypothetical protein
LKIVLIEKGFMRILAFLLAGLLLCGCTTTKKEGMHFADAYDAVDVEQMIGNRVTGGLFERTIVCLNGRRETRLLNAITNQSVVLVTNISLSYVTNQTITITSNQFQTLATNEIAAPQIGWRTNLTDGDANPAPSPAPASTNVALTTANNITLSRAGNQTVTTAGSQSQRSRQITTSTNNSTITVADNRNISAETNLVMTIVTNVTVNPVTNISIVVTNQTVRDYYLCAEFTPPPDFTLQSGESLILLVDGLRHGLTSSNSATTVTPRKGFTVALYRVSPQLLVDIANAREVRIRLKGNGTSIERKMNQASRTHFKRFLVKFFKPEDSAAYEQLASTRAQ